MASRKKRMVSDPNTTCPATCSRIVPTNMTAVNKPHMKRYAAMAVSLVGVPHPNFARIMSVTSDSQNKP